MRLRRCWQAPDAVGAAAVGAAAAGTVTAAEGPGTAGEALVE
jgi:hypothetical protein